MKNFSIFRISLSAFFLIILLSTPGKIVHSAEADPTPEPTPSLISIISIENTDLLSQIPAVTVWEDDYDALFDTMLQYQYVQALAAAPSGETEVLTLEVWWDPANLTTDFSTPGAYTETAPIIAPEGYYFSDGVMQSVSIPVIVAETPPEPTVITAVTDISSSFGYAIPQYSDWTQFFSSYFAEALWSFCVPCETADGETIYADIIWTDPVPDTAKTGMITVPGAIVLPEDTILSEGVVLPEINCPVSIQPAQKPALDCWYINYGSINFPWISGGAENRNARVLMRENEGDWFENGEFFWCDNEGIHLSLNGLKNEAYYEIKAIWDGGETEIFCFTYNGSVINPGYIDGDRDGSDSDGNAHNDVTQLPPLTQPTPSPTPVPTVAPPMPSPTPASAVTPPMPSPTPTPTTAPPTPSPTPEPPAESKPTENLFLEEVTDTYSLLSGTRIKLMLQNGSVRFSKQGVTVTLSDMALNNLGLTESSHFFIEIHKISDGFSLALTVDGQNITELPNTTVLLPYSRNNEDHNLTLTDEIGTDVSPGTYDSSLGIASFTVNAAGSYHVKEVSPSGIQEVTLPDTKANTKNTTHSLVPFAIGILTLLRSGTSLWRCLQ